MSDRRTGRIMTTTAERFLDRFDRPSMGAANPDAPLRLTREQRVLMPRRRGGTEGSPLVLGRPGREEPKADG